jgi:phage-related protein
MCLSCGCGKPNEDYGDHRHITMEDLDQAAQAAETTREQAVQNIMNTVAQAQGQQSSSGQSPQAQSGPAS